MSDEDAFFQLYTDLHREGPGDRDSLDWALSKVELPANGVICDAGCGSGADIAGLLAHVPEGRVHAVDLHEPYTDEARARFSGNPRVKVDHGNFGHLQGPYDLIWSAGAVYFIGITLALRQWKPALTPTGAVIFSQVFWKTDKPGQDSAELWADYGHMPYEADVYDQVRQGGFRVIAARELPDAAWEAYYRPLEARIAQLRPDADAALERVLHATEVEIATWRDHRDEFGYLQVVARPE